MQCVGGVAPEVHRNSQGCNPAVPRSVSSPHTKPGSPASVCTTPVVWLLPVALQCRDDKTGTKYSSQVGPLDLSPAERDTGNRSGPGNREEGRGRGACISETGWRRLREANGRAGQEKQGSGLGT